MERMVSENQNLSFRSLSATMERRNCRVMREGMYIRDACGRYTNYALMLSDQCPWHCEMRANGEFVETIGGSLISQLPAVESSVMGIRKSLAAVVGTNVPKLVGMTFREILLNAMCHRSYCSASPIIIEVSLQSVRITSPGGYMRIGISHRDRTRNPLLTSTLETLGFKNSIIRGYAGVIRAYRSC